MASFGLAGFSTRGVRDEQDLSAGTTTKLAEKRFVTVLPVGPNRSALDTIAMGLWRVTQAAVVEAGSTSSVINITGHSARAGDFIRVVSSAATITQMDMPVKEVTANTITLDGALDADLQAADTVDIFRPVPQRFSQDGDSVASFVAPPIQFVQDAATVTVTEDTVTPANNIPLPVKLTGATGDINITAGDLNVQLTHTGASPDSVQVGDGTEILLITASGEALTQPNGNVADNAADSGNPLKVGGVYSLAAPTLDDGDRGNLRLDVNSRLHTTANVSSDVAANAADSENPIKVGARYDAALPTYDDGDKTNLQTDANGRLLVEHRGLHAEDSASGDGDYGNAIHWKRQDTLTADTSANGDYIASKATANGELYVANLRLEALLPASLGQKANAASFAVTLSSEQQTILTAIQNAVEIIDNAIAGTEMQVDLVDLGGAATEAKQDTMITSLGNIETDTGNIDAKLPATLGQKTAANSLAVVPASDYTPPSSSGRTVFQFVRNDYSSVNVTTGAFVELTASIGAEANGIEIFDSSGQTLELATGAGGAEVPFMRVFPGGNGYVPVQIANGSRITIRAVSATASVGEIDINFYS